MAVLLIIEDDPLVARMYQKAFKFEGLRVEVAHDGREGLQKVKQLKPQLIFLDIMMPQMNGIEVLEHLKANPETKSIPVVMLTNLSGTQDAQRAIKRGALAYLVKSEHKPKDIAQKAKEILANKKPAPATPAAPQQTLPASKQTPTPPQPVTQQQKPK